jgi:tetratricopeptide (TPR) repeat protein
MATPATGTSSFGPAGILLLGGSGSSDDDTYSQLASQGFLAQLALSGISMGQANANLMAPSQQLTAQERKALEVAFKLIEDGALGEARDVLDDILQKNRNNGTAVHALGLIELTEGNHEEAEKLYRRADFLAPNRGYGEDAADARTLSRDDDFVFEQASQLVLRGTTRERGIGLLLRLVDRRPQDAETKILLAESLLAQKDILNAQSYFSQAIGISDQDELRRIENTAEELVEALPNAPQFRRLLGRVQVGLGKFEEALATLEVAAQLSGSDVFTRPAKALAYVGIGRKLLEQGDASRAVTNFKRAKELDPASTEVRVGLAEGYLAKAEQARRYGNLRAAITSYNDAARTLGGAGSESLRKIIAGGAFDVGLRLERQSIAAGRDLDEEALAFQAAYDLDRDNSAYKRKLAETRETLGDQFLAEEKYESAIGAYKRAYDLYSNNETYKSALIDTYGLRGDELLAQRQFDRAIETYLKGYRVDVADDTIKSKLAAGYNRRGLDYMDKEQPIQAVVDFKEALHLYPDNSEYQANYDAVAAYDY